MAMPLHKAPLSGLELLLIRKSELLKGDSITFSKQGCFHAGIPDGHPYPFPLGDPAG